MTVSSLVGDRFSDRVLERRLIGGNGPVRQAVKGR
jgi:hypothetical protein